MRLAAEKEGMQLQARALDVSWEQLLACLQESSTTAATASTLHGSHDHGVNCSRAVNLQTRPIQLRATPQAVHGQPNGRLTSHQVPTRGSTRAEKAWIVLYDWCSAACTPDWRRIMVCGSRRAL